MTIASWVRDRLGHGDRQIHPDWRYFLNVLHEANMATELHPSSLPLRLGSRAELAPDVVSIATLLDDYYRGDGYSELASRRMRLDRCLVHRDGEPTSARKIVSRLRVLAPELGPLALLEGTNRFVLRTVGFEAPLPARGIYTHSLPVGGTTFVRRSITVAALVGAANELLAAVRASHRFLPLDGIDGIEMYLAVTEDAAETLERVHLFEAPLTDLSSFAAWKTPESVAPLGQVA